MRRWRATTRGTSQARRDSSMRERPPRDVAEAVAPLTVGPLPVARNATSAPPSRAAGARRRRRSRRRRDGCARPTAWSPQFLSCSNVACRRRTQPAPDAAGPLAASSSGHAPAPSTIKADPSIGASGVLCARRAATSSPASDDAAWQRRLATLVRTSYCSAVATRTPRPSSAAPATASMVRRTADP